MCDTKITTQLPLLPIQHICEEKIRCLLINREPDHNSKKIYSILNIYFLQYLSVHCGYFIEQIEKICHIHFNQHLHLFFFGFASEVCVALTTDKFIFPKVLRFPSCTH